MQKRKALRSLAVCVGTSSYGFWSDLSDWPQTVNCYTLLIGAAQVSGYDLSFGLDRLMRAEAVSLGKLRALDLVLTTGSWGGFSWWDRRDVGHAYIALNQHTLIHASAEAGGVVTVSAKSVISNPNLFRGIVRLF